MSQRTAGNPPKQWNRGASTNTNTNATSSASSTASSSSITSFVTSPIFLLKSFFWFLGWWFSIRISFGSIYLIISALIAIFMNLSNESVDSNKKKLSAYSVFNPNATRIAGSLDGEAIANEIRHAPKQASKGIDLSIGDATDSKEHYVRKSKQANQPCVCGSGRKYKVCCSPLTVSSQKEKEEWEKYEKEWGDAR